jgi:hypothetical protein
MFKLIAEILRAKIQGVQSRRKLQNTVDQAQYSSQIAAVTVTVTARFYQC